MYIRNYPISRKAPGINQEAYSVGTHSGSAFPGRVRERHPQRMHQVHLGQMSRRGCSGAN